MCISKRDEVGRACSKHGNEQGAYRVLVEISEGRRTSRKPRSIWKDNIKMDLRRIW
jgi:hypothetical protein